MYGFFTSLKLSAKRGRRAYGAMATYRRVVSALTVFPLVAL